MSSVCVAAQEAPGNPYVFGAKAVSQGASTKDATAKRDASDRENKSAAVKDKTANVAHKKISRDRRGRSVISIERETSKGLAGVDMQTTASITSTQPPELVAKARKSGFGAYADMIARHASANGVPVSLAKAVIRVESNFRANARGRAGEVGLMQIKPATARGLGYSGSTKGLYDPETNIKWGMKYLGMAHKLGGGATCNTILKYNAGHGAKRMNPVSAAYCSKVKRELAS